MRSLSGAPVRVSRLPERNSLDFLHLKAHGQLDTTLMRPGVYANLATICAALPSFESEAEGTHVSFDAVEDGSTRR